MSNIFAENAPRLWAAGLPVLPLEPRGKAVKLTAWTAYCTTMPSEAVRRDWLATYPDGNIGLPLGPQAGLVAIDIDTDEPKIHQLLEQLLPASPWKRKGKKGCVYIYRYNGERTFRIKDESGKTILECLSQGAQIVLPPSIHPDTQRPYEANADLVDVLSKVPGLPPKIEMLLRSALIDLGYNLASQGAAKITQWIAAGGRDTAMTAHAGLLSRAVVKGQRTLAEALDEISLWVENYTERVAGDPLDPNKARQKVIEFFVRDCTGPKRSPVAPGWEAGLDSKLTEEIRAQLGEDGEAWDYHRFIDYTTRQFEIHPLNSQGYLSALNTIVTRMATGSSMTPLEEQMFIRFVSNCSNKQITLAALRQQVDQARRGEMEGADHTEIAQALVEELSRTGEMRFTNGMWWQWRGSHWEFVEPQSIHRVIAETFGAYPAARRHADHKGILNVAQSLVKNELVERPVDGINFANGFLTTDMKLVEHDPSYGKTYVLPYRYLPEAAGAQPRFMQLLHDCWGEDEDCQDKIQALREAIAATLFGVATRFQRAFCLFGLSNSGKSTICNIVKGLMPENSWCTLPPHQWNERFMPAQMYGKLMNFAGELSEDKLISGDQFKLIVEGSEIEAELKYQQAFKFSPRCAHWFATNHLPKTRDTSSGFNRRWLFLSFRKRVASEVKINRIEDEILAEEREAIASWAVQALPDLFRRHDYTLPASHLDTLNEVATSNNSVRFFIESGGVDVVPPSRGPSTPPRTSETTLYDAYYSFCAAVAHVKPVTLKNFSAKMEELQHDYGFKRSVSRTSFGSVEVFYESITLANAKAA